MSELWRPGATRAAIEARARLNALVREFFAARGVLEVETPVLSRAANTDPNIEPFLLPAPAVLGGAADIRWLRTSPEFAIKRLLAAGIGDCYELGRVFRAGEAGRRHNPEFTLLEWYRIGLPLDRLMDEVAELVVCAGRAFGRELAVARCSYRELFMQQLGLCPHEASVDQLREALGDQAPAADGLDRDDWLDLLMSLRIQPALPADRLLLVDDYPASQGALARLRRDADGRMVAARFEAFLGPLELANGFHELADADEQLARFEADLARRAGRGQPPLPIDRELVDALRHGLPDCSGVALGVDRLLLALGVGGQLPELLAFDWSRA